MFVVLAIFGLITIVFVETMVGDRELVQARHLIWHNEATYLAEAGLQLGLLALESGSAGSLKFEVGGTPVTVEVAAPGASLAGLVATAKVGDVTVSRTVIVNAQVRRGRAP